MEFGISGLSSSECSAHSEEMKGAPPPQRPASRAQAARPVRPGPAGRPLSLMPPRLAPQGALVLFNFFLLLLIGETAFPCSPIPTSDVLLKARASRLDI